MPKQIFAELQKLAKRLDIVVRSEPFELRVLEGRGGLCWLRGQPTVLMDSESPLVDKIGVLAEALAAFNVEVLYLPPIVRRRIARPRVQRR
ncbi:MAG: hypothetical protein WCI05_16900 [Myxococcales bacterium]